jgi:hypothetical protein
MRILTILLSIFILTSCATIVNDPNVPVAISLSDGSDGECRLTNKRVSLSGKVPSTFMVRRSDDTLRVDCTSESGKRGLASIPSQIEAGKLAGSVVFFDLGITDSITDKHRTYASSFVVPVN